MQAESVIEEEQEPAYLAEPGKPPSKTPLCPTILQSMFCFKNKIMHVLFSYVTPCHPKTIFKNVEWPILLLYSRI